MAPRLLDNTTVTLVSPQKNPRHSVPLLDLGCGGRYLRLDLALGEVAPGSEPRRDCGAGLGWARPDLLVRSRLHRAAVVVIRTDVPAVAAGPQSMSDQVVRDLLGDPCTGGGTIGIAGVLADRELPCTVHRTLRWAAAARMVPGALPLRGLLDQVHAAGGDHLHRAMRRRLSPAANRFGTPGSCRCPGIGRATGRPYDGERRPPAP